MKAPCPICKKVVLWEGNAFRPFCSERCQLLDLSGWLGERYRVPDEASEEWPEAPPLSDDSQTFPQK